jgi:hypothetical protein
MSAHDDCYYSFGVLRFPSPPCGARENKDHARSGSRLLKRAFVSAVALFCLCSGIVLAAPENPLSAPSAAVRIYSLGEFNQLRPVSLPTVKAYVIRMEYPLCDPQGECAPAFALLSDTPRERIADKRVEELIGQFPLYEYNTRTIENALNETRSGHAFLVLNAERTVKLESGKRYRLRMRATRDAWRYRSGLVLEDFCAEVDPTGRGKQKACAALTKARTLSLADFNRLRATPVIHTIEAYIVALEYPMCKVGGECHPVLALLSDTPPSRIVNKKVSALIRQFYPGNVMEIEKSLNETRSGHAFRVINLEFEPRSEQLEPEKRYRLRIRATDNPVSSTGLVLEDFCFVPDCAKHDEQGLSP